MNHIAIFFHDSGYTYGLGSTKQGAFDNLVASTEGWVVLSKVEFFTRETLPKKYKHVLTKKK